ncbi:hypothetical protein [Puerhibacterium puerhi]|uniref:hypothetical protein n=1 Tax=Puerhibacterium puerhi TaxID=2692623 RepID=UPI00135BD308|nr:hypothetical protein [Puerhibacterium puerhi]
MTTVPDLGRISQALAEGAGVRDVFGEPVERDGTLLVPVARVWTSGGAGGGTDTTGGEGPGGGGIGLVRHARPVGAYVIDPDGARWVPSFDVTRVVVAGQVAFAVVAVAVTWAVRRRRG